MNNMPTVPAPMQEDSARFRNERPTHPKRPARWHMYYRCITVLNQCIRDLVAAMRLSPQARILDFGCGMQAYRDEFPPACAYYGADLPGNPLAQLTLDSNGRVPLADESVDVVLSTQVLEHVSDPALYLKEAHRTLTPGGRLLLTTHGIFIFHPDPDDYWRWTSNGLRKQIERAGFRIVRMQGLVGGAAAALQMIQDMTWSKLPGLLHRPYFFLMQALITLLDRNYTPAGRLRDAWVYVVLAEKPR